MQDGAERICCSFCGENKMEKRMAVRWGWPPGNREVLM